VTGLLVALAGALGACSRVAVDEVVEARRGDPLGRGFLFGILAVNVTGSLVLGLVVGWAMYHGLSGRWRAVAGTGFCGGYTTFSTFAFDAVRLADEGRRRAAAVYVGLSIALSLAAAAAGLAVAAAWG